MKRAIEVLRRVQDDHFGAAWLGDLAGKPRPDDRAASDELIAAIALLKAVEPLREAVNELLRTGAMLSNCAYNLKQRTTLDDAARRSLAESQEAWDTARRHPTLRALIDDGAKK